VARLEVSDILNRYGEQYAQKHKLSAQQSRVIGALTKCRTADLGGHVSVCNECGVTKVFYNSCRDRHCPKCQSLAREQWLDKRRAELLPVQHYHLVFTVPPALNELLRYNERVGYSELFGQAWSALRTLCAEEKYLGARPGMLAVLHTWGQNLHYHPHVHALVPAGGLSFDDKRWRRPKYKNYLVPVKALSRLFRGRLVAALRQRYVNKELVLPPGTSLRNILDAAMAKDWVVYAKEPFAGPAKLLNYLGRYIKRIAISNDRLIDMTNDRVRFYYRDYADHNRSKVMDLASEEFIRRFLQHVLPAGFCKVRYYGLLAIRNRSRRLQLCHRLLGHRYKPAAKKSWIELLIQVTGQDPQQCPDCKSGRLMVVDHLIPKVGSRAPPRLIRRSDLQQLKPTTPTL
jgi:predicted Zn-ribbon and HTH transcriptional regulator